MLLDELADWLQPERRDRLRLALCVPDEVVDARTVQSLSYALDWGLALPAPLVERAIVLGIAEDEPALLMRRIAGLSRTSREAEHGGLEAAVLHRLWSEALELAARLGVALSDDALDAAKLHGGERAQQHADALAPSHDPSLDPMREQLSAEQPDEQALSELLSRGGYRDLIRCLPGFRAPGTRSGGQAVCPGRAAPRFGGGGRIALSAHAGRAAACACRCGPGPRRAAGGSGHR